MSTLDREKLRHQFLTDNGWGDAKVEALPSDMSFRRYFRLVQEERKSLLMDSPPDMEDIRPYVKVGQHLISLGLSTPKIESLDEACGFAIIEDFGNDTYNKLITRGESEWPLYELAVDTLAELHRHPQTSNIEVPDYGNEKLIHEALELTDWYYPALKGAVLDTSVRNQYISAWVTILESLNNPPKTLVLRDYHIDNLMILNGRTGIKQCGLLDFQDAVAGHPAYDLVSLLEDARRDIPADLISAMFKRYSDRMPHLAGDEFEDWYAILGVQRSSKIAGRFTRFLLRDGNDKYLCHIPRVMRLISGNLDRPILAPLKTWYDEFLPDLLTPLPDFDLAVIRKLLSI